MNVSWEPVDENLRHAMRLFSRATERGEERDLSGVTLVSSGVDYPVFNSAMLSTPVTGRDGGLDRRVALAVVHFSARRIGWSFWLCDEMLDAAERRHADAILAARGLRRLVENPGMAAESLAPPHRALPELDYRRIGDLDTRAAFCQITSVAFHLPFSVSQAVYGSARFWEGDYHGWVGYHQGRLVSTAVTLATGGAIGVYSVATLPEHRRRGFAEAVTRHALAQAVAESGPGRYVLQATPSGRSLYQRMGYSKAANFTVWVSA